MPLFEVVHRTRYRYARPVTFGEHRALLRPRDSHDLRLHDISISIQPKARLRWMHDVFSNSIALIEFLEPAAELTVAVNLSVGELERPELLAEAVALRREADLPPGALKLEVTEGDVMRDPEGAAVILRALRKAGAALALDDFGTGFSSLSYLTRLPFDTLKIDRYFVRTMATNEGSAKIVRSVIKLGQDLALEVVAEGVENAVMARALLDIGCDYGQGFGYAPALSPQEAEVYLNESYADGAAPLKARG